MDTAELIQIQAQFKELSTRIEELAKNKIVQLEPNESPSIKELANALSLAQKSFRVAYKNKQGSFTEYSDLSACLGAIKGPLGENGLSVSQPIMEDNGGLYLHTIIRHSSGEYTKSKVRIIPPTDGDFRKLCSQIAYLRRFSLASMVGIAGSGEDDDGELAVKERDDAFSAGTALKEQERNAKGFDVSGVVVTISQDQLDDLNEELKGWPGLCEEVKERWGLRSLADMPKDKYRDASTRIKLLKAERKNDKLK